MNIWLIIRLCWLIPVIIFTLFFILGILIIAFVDNLIDLFIFKTAMAKTEQEKQELRKTLYKLCEIKAYWKIIKEQLKKIFRL